MGFTADELREAFRPIASLISKSEKAEQKLDPRTWQHTMLGNNLNALHLAAALMKKGTGPSYRFPEHELREALPALAAMIERSNKAQSKFSPGTSHHTLQRNRLKALRVAEALIMQELESR